MSKHLIDFCESTSSDIVIIPTVHFSFVVQIYRILSAYMLFSIFLLNNLFSRLLLLLFFFIVEYIVTIICIRCIV